MAREGRATSNGFHCCRDHEHETNDHDDSGDSGDRGTCKHPNNVKIMEMKVVRDGCYQTSSPISPNPMAVKLDRGITCAIW